MGAGRSWVALLDDELLYVQGTHLVGYVPDRVKSRGAGPVSPR